jgi:hypothetical protein
MTAPTAARINPLVTGATSAHNCVVGALIFTTACRDQMGVLALSAQRGLRTKDAPVIGQVRKFQAGIATCLGKMHPLASEHAQHVLTQREYAGDENLHKAMRGYLDAMEMGGIAAVVANPAAAGAVSGTSFEINGNVREPKAAANCMQQSAEALGGNKGQAGALRVMRDRLVSELKLPADSTSPQLLAEINGQLIAVRQLGLECAAEFTRQFRKIHAMPKHLRATQYGTGGWADPKYAF